MSDLWTKLEFMDKVRRYTVSVSSLAGDTLSHWGGAVALLEATRVA